MLRGSMCGRDDDGAGVLGAVGPLLRGRLSSSAGTGGSSDSGRIELGSARRITERCGGAHAIGDGNPSESLRGKRPFGTPKNSGGGFLPERSDTPLSLGAQRFVGTRTRSPV